MTAIVSGIPKPQIIAVRCRRLSAIFVGEFVHAFREAGLRIGLYYSLIDFRIPAWYDGPEGDPEGWEVMKTYVYDQVRELLTNKTTDYCLCGAGASARFCW